MRPERAALALACALAACGSDAAPSRPWPDLELDEEPETPRPAVSRTAPAPVTTTTRATFAPGATPVELSGLAGGPLRASARRGDCAGFVTDAPGHVIEVAAETLVTLRVTSERDTTLLVRAPDGTWLCNDDFESLQPAIARTFGPGALEVWVGTWDDEDAGAPYVLVISSERDDSMPRGEPTVDRLNAVCSEVWCAGGRAYRFERVECGDERCHVTFTVDGAPGEVVLPVGASWGAEGLDERFVDALGDALEPRATRREDEHHRLELPRSRP